MKWWSVFTDWMLGKRCELHGERPASFFHECMSCLAIRMDKIRQEEDARKREERIEEMAEAIRRAGAR